MTEKLIYKEVSRITGHPENEVEVISKQVAKGANTSELAFFLNTCKSVGLNPFNKEIWCYKDQRGNLIIFTGRDGMLANAQKRKEFNGIRSVEYCKNDDLLVFDIPNGKIKHEFDPRKDRGELLGAYCIVFRKDGEPTIEKADMEVYNKGHNTWKTDPKAMIKKVAEAHALKKAFGMSGVQVEYDFNVDEKGIAIPLQRESKKTPIQEMKTKIIELLEVYQGEDKEEIRNMCNEKREAGEFDETFANNVIKQLGG